MIKIFEAFAGYGSQRIALKNANIPHESVGISEIDGDVVLSYAAIHENLLEIIKNQKVDTCDDFMYSFLEKINVPLDYKTFENKARKLKNEKLLNMYLANKLSKNFGDIRLINPDTLPDFDLFTYSFPCQDISIAGFQKGLDIDSGTRSSLLWDCSKIIEAKMPKYLIMENVKNLIGKKHKENFDKFLSFLKNLGYTNYWKVLNARDYNIPQNRERVFCVSILGEHEVFEFPKSEPLTVFMNDLLEEHVDQKFFLKNQYSDKPIEQNYIYCLDSNYWKGTFLKDFLEKKKKTINIRKN